VTGRPFKPGQSGNPNGRPKENSEVKALARKHTKLSIETLVEIAQGGHKDAARVAAASALLDRGYGKSSQHVEGDISQHHVISSQPETDEEWAARHAVTIEAAALPKPTEH
jgi:uncharacterized protein DUF5681